MRWKFDHAAKIIEVVLEGETAPDEATRFLDELEASDGIAYRKLIDATTAAPRIDDRVLGIVTTRIANYRNPGPIALVVPASAIDGLAKLFLVAVEAERRTRLFRTVAEAREWLDTLQSQETSP
jgi:hypothetical protein